MAQEIPLYQAIQLDFQIKFSKRVFVSVVLYPSCYRKYLLYVLVDIDTKITYQNETDTL